MLKQIEDMPHFITGSSLVKDLKPSDTDIVVLFKDELELVNFSLNFKSNDMGSINNDTRFLCLKDGNIDYICTTDVELFYRFKAFSGALDLMQFKPKVMRIALSKACLYWKG